MPSSNAVEEGVERGEATSAPVKASNPWAPVLLVIILMPAISYVLTQYVLIPKMRESLVKAAMEGVPLPKDGKPLSGPSASASKSAGQKDGAPTSFDCAFDSIIVNLAGTKGTRYLKTSFTVFSSNPELKGIITRHKSELQNLALNILSSKTLADLETPGSKNIILGELQENFNHALNSSIIEQIFFSEFVIQ
jgi:flagellar protein FliL